MSRMLNGFDLIRLEEKVIILQLPEMFLEKVFNKLSLKLWKVL